VYPTPNLKEINIRDHRENAVFWDVSPCRSCVNRRSSETSVHTRCTRHHIQEDGFLHNHRRQNLKSYVCDHNLEDGLSGLVFIKFAIMILYLVPCTNVLIGKVLFSQFAKKFLDIDGTKRFITLCLPLDFIPSQFNSPY
jgi:hypothetical protein